MRCNQIGVVVVKTYRNENDNSKADKSVIKTETISINKKSTLTFNNPAYHKQFVENVFSVVK